MHLACRLPKRLGDRLELSWSHRDGRHLRRLGVVVAGIIVAVAVAVAAAGGVEVAEGFGRRLAERRRGGDETIPEALVAL